MRKANGLVFTPHFSGIAVVFVVLDRTIAKGRVIGKPLRAITDLAFPRRDQNRLDVITALAEHGGKWREHANVCTPRAQGLDKACVVLGDERSDRNTKLFFEVIGEWFEVINQRLGFQRGHQSQHQFVGPTAFIGGLLFAT